MKSGSCSREQWFNFQKYRIWRFEDKHFYLTMCVQLATSTSGRILSALLFVLFTEDKLEHNLKDAMDNYSNYTVKQRWAMPWACWGSQC